MRDLEAGPEWASPSQEYAVGGVGGQVARWGGTVGWYGGVVRWVGAVGWYGGVVRWGGTVSVKPKPRVPGAGPEPGLGTLAAANPALLEPRALPGTRHRWVSHVMVSHTMGE